MLDPHLPACLLVEHHNGFSMYNRHKADFVMPVTAFPATSMMSLARDDPGGCPAPVQIMAFESHCASE